MTTNFLIQTLSGLWEIIADFLYFPVWWYSQGLKKAWQWIGQKIVFAQRSLGISIQFKYLFKPMYGDYSKSGRLISLFVRLIKLIIFTAMFLVWLVFILAVFAIYLILPAFIFYQIFF